MPSGKQPGGDPPAASSAVEVSDLSIQFPSRGGLLTVLDGITLSVPVGQFVSIIGPSGCGKSTLLKAMGGLLPLSNGSASVFGSSISAAREQHLFSYVFQAPALLQWRTALRNVMLPMELQGFDRRAARQSAVEMLDKVGLAESAHRFPRQLSGGMQQRVSIARALSTDPRLLLMDEPFGALDEITRSQMSTWLLTLAEDSDATVVFVTHSIREAVLLSDRIVVLAANPGRILADFEVALPRPRRADVVGSAEFARLREYGEECLAQAVVAGAR